MDNNSYEEKGYIFLKDVYSLEIIDNFNLSIRDFMINNNIYTHIKKKHDVSEELFYVNNTYLSLDSFQKMQYYYLPVIDNRMSHNRKDDIGMIDIFNADKLFNKIFDIFNINLILTIINKITGKKWKLLRTNIHLCNNVNNPTSYHFENIEESIKYTIFLSDILNDDYGPISYIENTHKIKNNIKKKDIKFFYGGKGDVLISSQNGLHRRLPQKNNVTGFLVFNFVKI